MEEQTDKEKIQELKEGESYIVPESDYGKAEIQRTENRFLLYSIPYAGGEPRFEEAFELDEIDELIETYESWT